MSDSAQVKMNAALAGASDYAKDNFRSFDLTQAATLALRNGVDTIDACGLWRVRLEDPKTADEMLRDAMVAELRRRAYEADDAYSAELRRVFGKAAGDARYDARGKSTPELRRLSDAKLAADAARRVG